MSESETETETEKPKVLKDRLQEHIAEYGKLALVIFLSMGALTLVGFYIAIKAGIDIGEGTSQTAGTLVAAWVATKLTMPIRIGATLVLTPILAKLLRRKR